MYVLVRKARGDYSIHSTIVYSSIEEAVAEYKEWTETTGYTAEIYRGNGRQNDKEFCDLLQAELRAQTAPVKGEWRLAVETRAVVDILRGAKLLYDCCWTEEDLHVKLQTDVCKEDPVLFFLDPVEVEVYGLVETEGNAALLVRFEDQFSSPAHPHIMVQTDENWHPGFVEELLEGKRGAYTFIPLQGTLTGKPEFYPYKQGDRRVNKTLTLRWHRDGVKKKRERLAPAKLKAVKSRTVNLVKELRK